MVSALVDVKALIFREETFTTQVPLARKEGSVTPVLKGFGQRRFFKGHALLIGRRQERQGLHTLMLGNRLGLGRTEPIRRRHTGGEFPRHDARPRRAAHRARGIGLRKSMSVGGQRIQMGRFVERRPKAAQIGPTQIVRQHEKNIRSRWLRGCVPNRQSSRTQGELLEEVTTCAHDEVVPVGLVATMRQQAGLGSQLGKQGLRIHIWSVSEGTRRSKGEKPGSASFFRFIRFGSTSLVFIERCTVGRFTLYSGPKGQNKLAQGTALG